MSFVQVFPFAALEEVALPLGTGQQEQPGRSQRLRAASQVMRLAENRGRLLLGMFTVVTTLWISHWSPLSTSRCWVYGRSRRPAKSGALPHLSRLVRRPSSQRPPSRATEEQEGRSCD